MSFDFQPYDSSKPRMVTSFKGNQKLIFEGYRYNIHHIVPAKGVKTWRCVCAKKLTSQRSWCKGRAETWDNDSQGLSKGEHNHAPEHSEAELEYFKSQLILAAITHPNANLNDLIEDAAKFMTMGLNFGSSRESLKKSLTQARKQAEIGGFKLKCYKNSGSNGGIGVSMVHRPKHSKKAATAALMKTEKSDTSFEHEDSDEPEPASPAFSLSDLAIQQFQPQQQQKQSHSKQKKAGGGNNKYGGENQQQDLNNTQNHIHPVVDVAAFLAQLANSGKMPPFTQTNMQQPPKCSTPVTTMTSSMGPIGGGSSSSSSSKKRIWAEDSGFGDQSFSQSQPVAKTPRQGGGKKRANNQKQQQQQATMLLDNSGIIGMNSFQNHHQNNSSFSSGNNGGMYTPPASSTASSSFSSSVAEGFDLATAIATSAAEGSISGRNNNSANANANTLLAAAAMAFQLHAAFGGNGGNSNNNVALPQPHQNQSNHQASHQASTPVTTTTGQKGRGSRGAAVPKNVPSSMASTLNATTATKNQQQQQQRKTSSPLLTTATNAAEKQKKAERVNSIFNKLSTKAKAAAAASATPTITLCPNKVPKQELVEDNNSSSSLEQTTAEQQIINNTSTSSTTSSSPPPFPSSPSAAPSAIVDGSITTTKKTFASVETQTLEFSAAIIAGGLDPLQISPKEIGGGGGSCLLDVNDKIRLSGCLRSKIIGNGTDGCECRIIRVCCCSDTTNCNKRHGENNSNSTGMTMAVDDAESSSNKCCEEHSPSSTSPSSAVFSTANTDDIHVPNPNTKEDDEHEEEEEEEENRDQDQIKATTDEDQLITAAVDSTSSPSITVKKEPLLVAVTSA